MPTLDTLIDVTSNNQSGFEYTSFREYNFLQVFFWRIESTDDVHACIH